MSSSAARVTRPVAAVALLVTRFGLGPTAAPVAEPPFLVVLGTAQDGGSPQAGTKPGARAAKHRVVSLGLVDPETGRRWLLEATPDFREQLRMLDSIAPTDETPGLAGIFLTHAHIGHYTGLMFLGHESMGAGAVPVYAMPRMAEFLRTNGPWSQLVRFRNIVLEALEDGVERRLSPRLSVTPFRVPHRQEYSEVVGFRVRGPTRTVLFLPDIDGWAEWDAVGGGLEDVLASVDVAYLDGTFFDDGEIPGRDMSTFPHPRVRETMARLRDLPAAARAKVRFIHLNHTNPALDPQGSAAQLVAEQGFRIAQELERLDL